MPYLSLFPNPIVDGTNEGKLVHVRLPFFVGGDPVTGATGSDRHFVELVTEKAGLFLSKDIVDALPLSEGDYVTVQLRTSVLSEMETSSLPGGKQFSLELEVRELEGSSLVGIGDQSVMLHFKTPEIDTDGLAIPPGTLVMEAVEDRCTDDPGVPATNHRGPDFEKDIEPHLSN